MFPARFYFLDIYTTVHVPADMSCQYAGSTSMKTLREVQNSFWKSGTPCEAAMCV
jgi:hypothetical protein